MYLPPDTSLTARSSSADANAHVPQVICAWPLSGQYGFGSRILFYLLVGTCVFARKSLWLRNTFLAATLLFPVVAALHAIVLAAKHVDGAVDMDIYGAFQLCSLGLVAGTLAVRISKTYYATPGRNTIFIWVTLILAGLLSLVVEFFRASPRSCPGFEYGKNNCDFICSEKDGPYSPLRKGAASDIYVIEAPTLLTFQAGVLLSAGCCVHAVVWMLYMLEKILREEERSRLDGWHSYLLQTTRHRKVRNGDRQKTPVKTRIILVVFGAIGLALLVVGERNFYSDPLLFEIEELSGVGQWSSIVTAILAAAGSLLVPLHEDMAKVRRNREKRRSSRALRSLSSRHWRSRPNWGKPKGSGRSKRNRLSRRRRRVRSSRNGRSYRVAVRFVDLEQVLDNFLKRVAGRTSRGSVAPEFPEVPGEVHRNPELSQLATFQESFNKSRTPSMRRGSHEGDTGDQEEGLESAGGPHSRQDSGGLLAVPRVDSRRSGVHCGL